MQKDLVKEWCIQKENSHERCARHSGLRLSLLAFFMALKAQFYMSFISFFCANLIHGNVCMQTMQTKGAGHHSTEKRGQRPLKKAEATSAMWQLLYICNEAPQTGFHARCFCCRLCCCRSCRAIRSSRCTSARYCCSTACQPTIFRLFALSAWTLMACIDSRAQAENIGYVIHFMRGRGRRKWEGRGRASNSIRRRQTGAGEFEKAEVARRRRGAARLR